MRHRSQSGNAVVMILVGVALFAALAYTFMRGGQQGQGNMSQHQARIAAQEILNFFNAVDKAANKLRTRGCSESEISFSSPKDTGSFLIMNHAVNAPGDKRCHVFDPAGGMLTNNIEWDKYQVSPGTLSTAQDLIGNVFFRITQIPIIDVGTTAPEYLISFNFIRPEICDAYNGILGLTIDQVNIEPSESAPSEIYGDNNVSLAGKTTFCHLKGPNIYNGGPHTQLIYVWLAR